MSVVPLLGRDGSLRHLPLSDVPDHRKPEGTLGARVVYAAAHVVPRTAGETVPGAPADLDWDATLAFRHHLWSWGLGVADAMDTAQRNMGMGWAATRELIARSAAEAESVGGRLVVGVNTDQLPDGPASLAEIADAYRVQLEWAEQHGATAVLMASRQLARAAETAGDYAQVYRRVLMAAEAPVVLHWLGVPFDPALRGYWGSEGVDDAAASVLDIICEHADRVAGIKMSLLDASAEVALRRRLPDGVRMFTGDDFNFVELIAGDERGHSDALLGAFAALGPVASAALQGLDAGHLDEYRRLLLPGQELSRVLFESPTSSYKAGVAFLSWLNGHQDAYLMVGGVHAARSLPHLSELVRLADAAGALEQPELAARRWTSLLAVHGVPA